MHKHTTFTLVGHRMFLLAFLLPLVAPANRAPDYPDFPIRPIRSYAIHDEKSGIAIAVVPLDDSADQKTYFSIDARSKRFLPVFVVLQNETRDVSCMLNRDEITFGSGEAALVHLTRGSAGASRDGERLADTGVILGSLPLAIVGTVKMIKAAEVKQNILKKELRSQTLSPGQTGHGFLYVPVDAATNPREKIRLRVRLSLTGSKTPVEFDLVF